MIVRSCHDQTSGTEDLTCGLRIATTRFDLIKTGANSQKDVDLPYFLRVLLSTALATRDIAPICVLLPSTAGIVQVLSILASLECLAADSKQTARAFVENELKPGIRVRRLPDGFVYQVGERRHYDNTEGLMVNYIGHDKSSLQGRFFVPLGKALQYEPTLRKRPLGRARYKNSGPPLLTPYEGLAGARTYSNTALIRNRIILIGSRLEFERVLKDCLLVSGSKLSEIPMGTLADTFPWGGFDTTGAPVVVNPPGAGGQPLVAISADLLSLEPACLSGHVQPASQIILTDRFDLVLRHLDLAGRLAERQRVILLGNASRREDTKLLRNRAWTVWEPRPTELAPLNGVVPPGILLPGVDRILQSAMAESRCRVSWAHAPSGVLAVAHGTIERLGTILTSQAAATDECLEELLASIRGLFFRVTGWLQSPGEPQLAECRTLLQRLVTKRRYLEQFVGEDATTLLNSFIKAIDEFIRSVPRGDPTPKGAVLLDLAQEPTATPASLQALITGNTASRVEAEAVLNQHKLQVKCLLASDIWGITGLQRLIAFSLMRRDAFGALADPWPAPHVTFVGYDFETTLYRRRLEQRARLQESGRLTRDQRERMTGLDADALVPDVPLEHNVVPVPPNEVRDAKLAAFDRVTAQPEWHWANKITVPKGAPGDATIEARLVRFVGRSWMAITEDHRCLAVTADPMTSSRQRPSQVAMVEASDLCPGTRLILRETGEKDIIRILAEQRVGAEKYMALRRTSSLWRDAIRRTNLTPDRIAGELAEVGVRRHVATIRSWLVNDQLIGPRSDEDVMTIGETFPVKGKAESEWRSCCDAISELRGLHLSAGFALSEMLTNRCGSLLFEPSDTEIAVDLGVGTVWVIQVGEVGAKPIAVPAHLANRLHWTDLGWRARLLAHSVQAVAI